MDNYKKYILLHRFKTDVELARETGLSPDQVQEIRRQINGELWMERISKRKRRTGRF